MGSSMVQALLRWWTEQKAALNGTWKLLSSVRDPPLPFTVQEGSCVPLLQLRAG